MSDKLIRLNPRNSPGCENGFGRSAAVCCGSLFYYRQGGAEHGENRSRSAARHNRSI